MEILISGGAFTLANKVIGSNKLDRAMVKLEKTIPCLLHLENRSSEAIVANFFHHGLQL
jgi:hypothetical protein